MKRQKPPAEPAPPRPPLWTAERAAALALGVLFVVLDRVAPGPRGFTPTEALTLIAFPVLCVWSPGLAELVDRVVDPRPVRNYSAAFVRWFGWAALVLVNGVHQYLRWTESRP